MKNFGEHAYKDMLILTIEFYVFTINTMIFSDKVLNSY